MQNAQDPCRKTKGNDGFVSNAFLPLNLQIFIYKKSKSHLSKVETHISCSNIQEADVLATAWNIEMTLSAGRCQFIARDKSGGCFFFSLSPSPSRGWYRGHIDRHAAWTSRGFHANAARAGVIFLVRFYNGRPKLGLAIARVDFLSRSDRNRPDLQSELR